MFKMENSEFAPPVKNLQLNTVFGFVPNLRFVNQRNASFVNSTIQSIAQMPTLLACLQNHALHSPIVQEFGNVMLPGDRNVTKQI